MSDLNKEESNIRSVVPFNSNDNQVLIYLIELIGFLLASSSRSRHEWDTWAVPYFKLICVSQLGSIKGEETWLDLKEKLLPCVSEGFNLWVEEEDCDNQNQIDESFVVISHIENNFTKHFKYFEEISDEELGIIIGQFFDRYYDRILSQGTYDARTRSLSRHICSLLNFSMKEFSFIETQILTQKSKKFNINSEKKFLTKFNEELSNIPKSSLMISNRILKVAFIATCGGAMVGLAGYVAAPTVVNTFLPLLLNTTNYFRLSVTLDTFLNYIGYVVYPLMPTFYGSYGANIARVKMLKRTAEIEEFELIPLHIRESKTDTYQHQFVFSASYNQNSICPIYILISGHLDNEVDERAVWGGNGTLYLLDTKSRAVSFTKIVNETQQLKGKKNGKKVSKIIKYESSNIVNLISEIIEKRKDEANLGHSSIPLVLKERDDCENEIEVENETEKESENDETHISMPEIDEELEGGILVLKDSFPTTPTEDIDEWQELNDYHQGWWRDLVPLGEEYILNWSRDYLKQLNNSLFNLFKDTIYSKFHAKLMSEVYKFSIFSPLNAIKRAFSLPKLALSKLKGLDDIWSICLDRAQQGGKLLAKVLIQKKKNLGNNFQPVNLIGYGMGARLIFHCLEHLYELSCINNKEKESCINSNDCFGLIDNVVIIGAPVSSNDNLWSNIRNLVNSRLINCYSRYDWILALLYRSRTYELNIAGLEPIIINNKKLKKMKNMKKDLIQSVNKKVLCNNNNNSNQSKNPIDKLVDIAFKVNDNVLNLFDFKQRLRSEILNNFDVEIQLTIDEHKKKNNNKLQVISMDINNTTKNLTREDNVNISLNKSTLIENYDITELISHHCDYPIVLPSIIKLIDI